MRGDGSSVARDRYKFGCPSQRGSSPGPFSAGEVSSRIGLSLVVHEQPNRDWVEYVESSEAKSMIQMSREDRL